jgi:hypothetical protein
LIPDALRKVLVLNVCLKNAVTDAVTCRTVFNN